MNTKRVCGLLVLSILATGDLRRAEAAILNPTSLSDLRLWLDATDTGTISSTLNAVSQWNDKSSQAFDVTQSTGTSQPLTNSASLNGLNVIKFDGIDDFLLRNGPSLPLSGGDDTYTYFAVWRPSIQATVSVYEQSQTPQTTGTRAALLQAGGNYGFNGQSNDAHIVPYTSNSWRVTAIESNGNPTSNIVISDNSVYGAPQTFTATINTGTQNVGTSGIRVGNKLTTDTENFNGNIAELIVYDRVLTSTEKSDVLSYLNGKYSLGRTDSYKLAHRWSFNDGTANDSVGNADGTVYGGAVISGGRIQFDGVNDFVQTVPIDHAITTKTLVAWVSLDNSSQRSGGVLTLENPTGSDVFDSIVYGERTANQWMNGSNSWSRSGSADNLGALDTSIEPTEVMIAIAYRANGDIAIYRNGSLYTSYNTGAPISYLGGTADVVMGVRHGDLSVGTGTALGIDAFFAGYLNEARIYATDLSAVQIAALYQLGPELVPEPSSLMLFAGVGLGATRLVRKSRRRRFGSGTSSNPA